MVTTTTQYSFQKPTVGDDEDAWGGYLNSNFDSIDSLLRGATSLSAIDVTGTVTAGGLTVNESNNVRYSFSESGTGHAYLTIRAGYNTKDSQITFSNNTNSTTGSINYDHTSNFMKFSTNGANERMRIASNGDISFYDTSGNAKFFWDASEERLGIGTTSPSATLALHNSTNYPYIHFNNTSGTNIGYVGWHGGTGASDTFQIGANQSKSIALLAGGSERIRITSAGNVGIGTTSPTHTISLESAYPYISFNETDQSQKWVIGGASGNFIIYDDTDAATRLAVDGSGNVGIGTSSPSADLHIQTTSSGSNNNALYLHNNATAASTSSTLRFANSTDVDSEYGQSKIVGIRTSSDGTSNLVFHTSNAGTLGEAMRISGSGRVGIGTTSPSSTLDVNGAITTTGQLTVDNDNGIKVISGSETANVYYTGYGIDSARSTTYIRPQADNTQTLYIGNWNDGLDWNSIQMKVGSNDNVAINGNTVWHAGNDGSGSGLDADTLDGVEGANYLRSDQADTIDGNLTIGGTAHIAMQEGHYVNRRFEVDSADNSGTIYILLCRNAANNDVNGTITMDRTSGLRHACKWDIIVSSGSSTTPIGSLMGHSLSGGGQPSARLVTLTYSSVSYVALELTNPDYYYESTGAYFTGRIVNSGSNTFTCLKPASVSSVSSLYISTSKTTMSYNLEVGNSIIVPNQIIHDGDTDTYINFRDNAIDVYTGNTQAAFSSSGLFLTDGSLAEDYDALSGTTPTCNVDNGGAFSLTMTGNTTFTFSGAASGYSQGFVLQLTGHSTTAYTVDFGTNNNVKWAGGTAPDAPAAGETDIYVFWTRDGGTTWYGVHSIDAAS